MELKLFLLSIQFSYLSIDSYVITFRCATGEAWPDIMLDATSGRECDPLAVNYNETTGTKILKLD